MLRYILMAFILFFCICRGAAAVLVSCGGTADTGSTYTIPSSELKMTTPNAGNGANGLFYPLYTIDSAMVGGQHIKVSCNYPVDVGFTVTDIPEGTTFTNGIYKIYPTSVKGIGVSFTMAMGGDKTSAYSAWPNVAWYQRPLTYSDVDTKLTIIVWKTPEYTLQTGTFGFVGPTFNEIISTSSSANTMGKCPAESLDARTCVYLSRKLIGNVQFSSGTCEIVNTVQTVQMGSFNGNGGNSAWKDASFRLKCADAWGYGAQVKGSTNSNDVNDGTKVANNTKNSTVMIQVLPYTAINNPNRGIIELEPGGAEGYGIQLAWGNASTQTNNPTNSVRINTPINLQSVNSDFKLGPYEFGDNVLTVGGDNLVPFSARYIRTSGNIVPGPANASIEILASYQ